MEKSMYTTMKTHASSLVTKTSAVIGAAYLTAGQAVAQTTGRYQTEIQAAGDAATADAALSGGMVVAVLGTLFGIGALVYLARKI